jgi:hypothetical protein
VFHLKDFILLFIWILRKRKPRQNSILLYISLRVWILFSGCNVCNSLCLYRKNFRFIIITSKYCHVFGCCVTYKTGFGLYDHCNCSAYKVFVAQPNSFLAISSQSPSTAFSRTRPNSIYSSLPKRISWQAGRQGFETRLSFSLLQFYTVLCQIKSKSHCDWRSVSQSVLVSSPHLGLITRYLLEH